MTTLVAKLRQLPVLMVIAVLFLCAVGLLCIRADDPEKFVKQLAWAVLGLVAMGAVIPLPYRKMGEYSYVLLGVTLVMLAAVFVLPHSISPVINGARRWFRFGPVNFQPSELAKIAFILALAWYLRYRKNYRSLLGLVLPFVLTLVPMGLVLVEPDLGTSLLFLPTLFAMLYLAGAKSRHLIVIVLLGAISMPVFYFTAMKDHQKSRIDVWLTQGQARDPVLQQASYHFNESLLAVGSGGLMGQGSAESIYVRYDLLPEDNTDFIFSLIANQWGFVGCIAVVAAYLVIFAYGVEIAASTADPFGRLLAVGVVALFAAQMFINVGMAVGLLPITGMTLPFVSYGGSSLLINFVALGILINVGLHRPIILAKRRFEWDEDEQKLT